MNRCIRLLLGLALAASAAAAHAQTCTTTISAGGSLQTTMQGIAAGSTICLNAGTYTPDLVAFPANGAFAIGKNITIRGLGATPAQVVLQANNVDHAIYVTNYLGVSASGAQLVNLTITGAQGGVQIQNFTASPAGRITDIKLKDVVINATAAGNGFGFKALSADRVVLDNVTITSNQTAINLIDTTDSLVMNSTVTNTIQANAAALSVLGGSANRILNNSFGQPRTVPGSGYSFTGGGIVFYNTSDNRFEGNLVQGMRDDAVDFTIADLSANGLPLAKSLNNYVGKNRVVHTAWALDGLVLGSSGIWSNCASDGTWIYGNDSTGNAECGVCVWGSKSNMVLGNMLYNNGITGAFVSGGQEALDNCAPAGNTSFRQKPVSTFLQSNALYFNRNDQSVVRNSDSTDVTRNLMSPTNGPGGAAQSCISGACQSMTSIETDSAAGFNTSTGARVLLNTNHANARGIWVDNPAITGIEFYGNRSINVTNSRLSTSVPINIDRGSVLGGNYWTQAPGTGNPSTSGTYFGVFDSVSNTTGKVGDRFPYKSENLGRGFGFASVSEPRLGALVARGTKRTVRWDAMGCVYIDLYLNGTTALLTNAGNTGYAIVTIPVGASLGTNNIQLRCKDSGNVQRGAFTSSNFTVTDASLAIVSPGRDDTFNTSQSVWVSWTNTNPAVNTSVAIDYSSDGGTTWSSTLATVSGISASNPVTSTRVTLPATASSQAVLRVRSGGSLASPGTVVDQLDGVFALRGATGAFTNTSPTRSYQMGQAERLEWTSPQGSKLVTLTATVGATSQVIADIPDRGSFDWIPPDLGAGALTLSLQFKTIAGGAISTATNATAGNTRYPTTITFGTPPTVTPPGTGTLTATTNSGAAVTLTSSTPSICTVSGTTITGVANGNCVITGNAPATGNFVAALASTITFAIGQSQTISFASPGAFLAVGSSITMGATASSGLAVTFSSLTTGFCTVAGAVVTGIAVGNCTVAADQAGNATYAAAPQVTYTLQTMAAANIPRLVNISTRMQVLTGQNVLIGGLIIGGQAPKTVAIRARGPSLIPLGVPNAIADPQLQLFSGATQIDFNDNWQQHANASLLNSAGFAPSSAVESAIYTTLAPGAYTAIVTGVGGGTGVGIIEAFEVDRPERPLLNIATRGQVLTGGDVMIAGFIIQGSQPQTVAVRARGPSLAAQGVVGPLQNPKLDLYSGQTVIATNDDWQTAANAAQVNSSGFAPSDTRESVILITLNPGAYTAIVTGVGGTTGVAIVEVFGL